MVNAVDWRYNIIGPQIGAIVFFKRKCCFEFKGIDDEVTGCAGYVERDLTY